MCQPGKQFEVHSVTNENCQLEKRILHFKHFLTRRLIILLQVCTLFTYSKGSGNRCLWPGDGNTTAGSMGKNFF